MVTKLTIPEWENISDYKFKRKQASTLSWHAEDWTCRLFEIWLTPNLIQVAVLLLKTVFNANSSGR